MQYCDLLHKLLISQVLHVYKRVFILHPDNRNTSVHLQRGLEVRFDNATFYTISCDAELHLEREQRSTHLGLQTLR